MYCGKYVVFQGHIVLSRVVIQFSRWKCALVCMLMGVCCALGRHAVLSVARCHHFFAVGERSGERGEERGGELSDSSRQGVL